MKIIIKRFRGMRPIHPGEILCEDYMVPLGLSAIALAHALGVTPASINDIVRERRDIEKPHPQNVSFLVGPTNRHKDCNDSRRLILYGFIKPFNFIELETFRIV